VEMTFFFLTFLMSRYALGKVIGVELLFLSLQNTDTLLVVLAWIGVGRSDFSFWFFRKKDLRSKRSKERLPSPLRGSEQSLPRKEFPFSPRFFF